MGILRVILGARRLGLNAGLTSGGPWVCAGASIAEAAGRTSGGPRETIPWISLSVPRQGNPWARPRVCQWVRRQPICVIFSVEPRVVLGLSFGSPGWALLG